MYVCGDIHVCMSVCVCVCVCVNERSILRPLSESHSLKMEDVEETLDELILGIQSFSTQLTHHLLLKVFLIPQEGWGTHSMLP